MATKTDADQPRKSIEHRIRTEHPIVWEMFEAWDAEFLARHGTVEQGDNEGLVDGGWYVACDEPSDDEGWMVRGASSVICAHAGPFVSEAAAWERLDALREAPYALLLAWADVAE